MCEKNYLSATKQVNYKGVVDVEKLEPHFHSEQRVSSVTSGVLNLMSTILGGGVLSLPYALKRAGLIPGTLIFIFLGIAIDFSVYILVSCGRRLGAQTIDQVVHEAFGHKMKRLCMGLLISVTYIPLVAYIILLRDLMAPVLEFYFYHHEMSMLSKNVFTAACLIMIAPACLIQQLNNLKVLCLVNVITVLMLIPGMVVRCIQCNVIEGSWLNVNLWSEEGIFGFLQSIPIVLCSYVCHFNVLSVHSELKRPTRARIHRTVHYTALLVTLINMLIAYSGFSYGMCAGMEGDNILNSFTVADNLMNIGRMGLVIATVLSFPLLVVPCRDVISEIFSNNVCSKSEVSDVFFDEAPTERQLSALEVSIVDEYSEEGDDEIFSVYESECEENINDTDFLKRFIITVGILASAMSIAAFVTEVSFVWGILGSTANIFVAFCIPAAAYIHVRQRYLTDFMCTIRLILAWILLVVSCILSVLCTALNIYIIVDTEV